MFGLPELLIATKNDHIIFFSICETLCNVVRNARVVVGGGKERSQWLVSHYPRQSRQMPCILISTLTTPNWDLTSAKQCRENISKQWILASVADLYVAEYVVVRETVAWIFYHNMNIYTASPPCELWRENEIEDRMDYSLTWCVGRADGCWRRIWDIAGIGVAWPLVFLLSPLVPAALLSWSSDTRIKQ